MKVVVTGGAGFIGSHIVEELVKRGADVVVIDNLCEGKKANIAHLMSKIRFVKGDIRDLELLRKEFKGIDYISHQAALRSVPGSVERPEDYNDVNINGHFNVLKAASECKVKRVVFASSSSVYGEPDKFPEKEDFLPDPRSPYALTKAVGEYYCSYFYHQYGLETVSLRYFNVFGPRQDPNSQYAAAIPIFTKAILNGKAPTVFGDGSQSRDFTHIRNVVEANIIALTAPNAAGDTFNVCDGISITVNDLIKKINKILGKDIKPEYTDERAGDVQKTQGSAEKAKKVLGLTMPVKFDDGLKETVMWFKEHKGVFG